MTVTPVPHLPELRVVDPTVFGDARGFFMETWNEAAYAEAGIDVPFVQDNLSRSARGVLRGLHFQNPHPQAKLVSVLHGEVLDVVVDVRAGSDTFGTAHTLRLSEQNKRQLFIPAGFAHGFVVLSDAALFHYKCSAFYAPEAEHSVRWNDPALGIDWPVEDPIVSDKDAAAPRLADLPDDALRFEEGSHAGDGSTERAAK